MEPRIWALADDRAGNRSQCLGVAGALGLPFEVKEIRYGIGAKLPNLFLGASLRGLETSARARLTVPWPDLVVAAGRRTAPVARWIKAQDPGRVKLLQVMDPGGARDGFDLIAVPAHDQLEGSNVITITTAPHGLTAGTLAAARATWAPVFADLPKPWVAVIVGGSTKNRRFNVEMGRDLGIMANMAAMGVQGSLLITTSRRTDAASANALFQEITVPHHRFRWGDGGDNPYLGYLASADFVVVTGESVSMCSEACASGKPVHIYAPGDLIAPKHARLHGALFQRRLAHPFRGALSQEAALPFNAADEVAAAAHRLLKLIA